MAVCCTAAEYAILAHRSPTLEESMMFYALLRALLPRSNSDSKFWAIYTDLSRHIDSETVKWHKAQLVKLDPEGYGLETAMQQLVRDRNIARENGINAMDPQYPSIRDYYPGAKDLMTHDFRASRTKS